MLHKAHTLQGYKLHSRDGDIGTVKEFYFDDKYWTIRYLVADTGNWLTGRQVLVSPYALGHVNAAEHHVSIDLTKEQIEASPALGTDKPVSRQFEEAFTGYYGMPLYWAGPYMWGIYPYIARPSATANPPAQRAETWDPHLRSTHAVRGHHIQATDGAIGHVADFVIDDETWAIRYFIIDTQNWWPGKKILVSPLWIDRVSWDEAKVYVNLTRATIQQSPEYTEAALLTRDYETALHHHYQRSEYWLADDAAVEPAVG